MSEKQEPNKQDNDDDLLADFRDVLGDDMKAPEAGSATAGGENEEALTELDAFLNEFGQGDDNGKAGKGAWAEDVADIDLGDTDLGGDDMVPDAMGEAMDAPPADDLDLSGLDDVAAAEEPVVLDEVVSEPFMEEMSEPEPEPAPQPKMPPPRSSMDDLFTSGAQAMPPVAAAAAPVVADEPAPRRSFELSTLGIAIFSLVVAAAAGWYAVTLHADLTQVRAEVEAQRQQPVVPGPVQDVNTQQELVRISQRLNEMALILEGPMSHLNASGQQMDEVIGRLEEVEKAVAGLHEELAKGARSAPAKAAAAAPVKSAPVAAPKSEPKPVAKPAAKAAAVPAPVPAKPTGGDWVVNLASFADERVANAEVSRLKQAGIVAEVQKASSSGSTWYRVRVTGFPSREAAAAYGEKARTHVEGKPWVGLD